MPRYRPKQKTDARKPLKTAHQRTVFLRNLSDEEFEKMKVFTDKPPDHIHPDAVADLKRASKHQLIHGLWVEQGRKYEGEPVGGGLTDAFSWVMDKIGLSGLGKSAYNLASNTVQSLTPHQDISNYAAMVARGIHETYNSDQDARMDRLGPYERDTELSNDWLDVWVDDDRNAVITTVRGSRDANDWLVQDVKIGAGQSPDNLIGDQLEKIWDKYESGNSMTIAGHSLGASMVANSLDKEDLHADKTLLFNPGVTPWSKEAVSDRKNDPSTQFYINSLDVVSSGIDGSGSNVYINKPQSWINPVDNHSVTQWYKH
jgi:hypothetical protein